MASTGLIIGITPESGVLDNAGRPKVNYNNSGANEFVVKWLAKETGTFYVRRKAGPINLESHLVTDITAIQVTTVTITGAQGFVEGANAIDIAKP